MPAYYIVSGDLDTKIFAKNSHDACIKALKRACDDNNINTLGLIISSDERGTSLKGKTKLYPTLSLLRECGLENEVEIDPIIGEIDAYFRQLGDDENKI